MPPSSFLFCDEFPSHIHLSPLPLVFRFLQMSAVPHSTSTPGQITGAQAVIAALLRCGINSGYGIPSIHNIPLYEAMRQTPEFHHWVVRHEQAAGFAADGYYRRSGRIAAIFASTGPGNLFTVVPLLESLQTGTPVLLIGTNIASPLLGQAGGALHETPQQLEIIRPLTRFARRVNSPAEIAEAVRQAAEMLHGPLPGPAFIEIPHDFFHAAVSANFADTEPAQASQSVPDAGKAQQQIMASRKPAILVGAGARQAAKAAASLLRRSSVPFSPPPAANESFPPTTRCLLAAFPVRA